MKKSCQLALQNCTEKMLINLEIHKQYENNVDSRKVEALKVMIEKKVDSVLLNIGKKALGELFKGKNEFTVKSENHVIKEARKMGIIIVPDEEPLSRKSSANHVRFLHKTFQEICAAVYWSSLAENSVKNSNKKFTDYLQEINKENVDNYEYLLRFCCGGNVKAVAPVVSWVANFRLKQRLDYEHSCLFGVGYYENREFQSIQVPVKNPWKLPIMLLHEAG